MKVLEQALDKGRIFMKKTIYSEMMNGLNIDRVTRDAEYNMIKHWHPECEIQYYYSGKRHFFIEQQHYPVTAGSLVIVDSQQVHNTYSDKELHHERLLLLFEKEKFQEGANILGVDLDDFFLNYRGVIQIPQADRPFVETCLADLAKEVNQKNYLYQSIVQIRLVELLIYLIRLKSSGAREKTLYHAEREINDIVNEVGYYIRENYATVGSLEDIAKTFYLDKCYLSRVFKRCTGYTITEFTNIQRIQQAQRLLEDTEMTVAEISNQIGYENITYFNRVFKKYIETSPLKYRKKQIAYKESLREKNNF